MFMYNCDSSRAVKHRSKVSKSFSKSAQLINTITVLVEEKKIKKPSRYTDVALIIIILF